MGENALLLPVDHCLLGCLLVVCRRDGHDPLRKLAPVDATALDVPDCARVASVGDEDELGSWVLVLNEVVDKDVVDNDAVVEDEGLIGLIGFVTISVSNGCAVADVVDDELVGGVSEERVEVLQEVA